MRKWQFIEHEIPENDVIPLAFYCYGRYAKGTLDSLRMITNTIADGDPLLTSKLMKTIREIIAVSIHTEHAGVIQKYNKENKIRTR